MIYLVLTYPFVCVVLFFAGYFLGRAFEREEDDRKDFAAKALLAIVLTLLAYVFFTSVVVFKAHMI